MTDQDLHQLREHIRSLENRLLIMGLAREEAVQEYRVRVSSELSIDPDSPGLACMERSMFVSRGQQLGLSDSVLESMADALFPATVRPDCK
tara:strand:- start:114394 stop:114666 length:273 start_codon:yes stop_codon:yes gene_type:complete